jgi:UDPglucose--hexose-1-phosphate uridylyltransferase
VFVNTDWESGASIAHPHAQLIALDFVPPALDQELAIVERSIAEGHGPDPLRRDLDLSAARDLMVVDDDVAAWCPWEMPNPFGVRIAPKVQRSRFAALEPGEVAALAGTLGRVLRAVNDVLGGPAYNIVFFDDHERDGRVRRWRVEVVPRVNVPGGFEIGTGVTTHSTDTLEAARALRLRALPATDRPTRSLSGRVP